MNKTERVQQLCSEHSQALKGLAKDVCAHGRWDMNLPVAVIDARKLPHRFHISAVGTIGNILRVSTTADNPLMQQLFELYEERGSDAALQHMLTDEVNGDEFAQLFETYKEERRLGSPLWSASDAASFVVKSKEAFDDQELAIVALLPGNPYDLVSFGIPWAFYGGLQP